MNRLFTLACAVAAVLVVGVGGMAVTARPTIAQNPKPPSDVRVVNSAAEPVPISVQGTPTVNVGTIPSIAVSSVPAVQVGNPASNPVKVQVQNFPAPNAQPEMFNTTVEVLIAPGSTISPNQLVFNVPAGKRLEVEFVSFRAASFAGESFEVFVGGVNPNGQGSVFLGPEVKVGDYWSAAERVQFSIPELASLYVQVIRSAVPGGTVDHKTRVSICGHLYPMQ